MSATEWWCRLFCHFFCRLSVTETQSAKWRDEESWFRVMLSLMKAIYLMHNCFVCLCSALSTFTYSHERITQKWAAPASLPIAWQSSVDFEERMRRKTQTGRDFLLYFFWIVLFFWILILVDNVKDVQHCVWGRHAHFPWRPQPHGWGWYLNLRLCFQPGEHDVVKKIALDAQPWQSLQWFRFSGSGICLWGKGCLWVRCWTVLWRPSFVVQCVSTNCCLTGSRSRSEVNHVFSICFSTSGF